MTEPQPSAKPIMAEPGTARALWPTFMRRTLPVEDVEDAAPEPRRARDVAAEAALKV